MAEKNIAFVTFVDSECANLFYDRTQLEGLIFKGKRVKVGWGKATPLPTSVQIAVQSSLASRNVYIGSIDDQMSEQRLLRDFGEFGDIELINIISDKNIAFVNFTDILSAIRAVEVMKNCSDYHRYKINYGKDRCGNIPRSPRSINHHSNSTVFNSQILSEQQVTQQSLLHQSFFESLLNTSPQNTTPHNFAQQPWSDQSALNLQSTPQRPPSTLGIRPSTPLSSSNGNNYYSSSSLQYTNDNDAEYTSMLGNFSKYNLNPPGFNEHQMRQNAFQSKFEREFFGGVGTIGSSRSPNKFGNTIVRQNSAPSMW